MGALKLLWKLEAFGVCAGAVMLNGAMNGDWLPFFIFALAPDLTLFLYKTQRNLRARWPAILHNAVHSYAAPALLAAPLWLQHPETPPLFLAGWVAHIAFDRFWGPGFKPIHAEILARPGAMPEVIDVQAREKRAD